MNYLTIRKHKSNQTLNLFSKRHAFLKNAKFYIKLILAISTVLVSNCAFAELPSSVVDALKNAGIAQNNVAIYVQAVDAPTPILTLNAGKSMNPASVMKLVTTYAALDLLTPAYRWKTEVYRDGNIVNGVLNGNLIIKGFGDPSFKAQEFWRLLMSLRQAGIRDINGDLLIDKSVFAKNVGNRKTFDAETWRAYNAEPSAFLVNGRNTSFKFSAIDSSVSVTQEFDLPEIQIVNNMKLSSATCENWRDRFTYTVKSNNSCSIEDCAKNAGVTVTFKGTFSPSCNDRYLELSLLNDEQYAFYTFKKLWQQLGGKFNGQLKMQSVPTSAIKVITQDSEPLGYVVRDINKWSNNIMARQLLLTLGVEKRTLPATESSGATVIKEWFASKNINATDLVVENGSGLSRTERISAQHLGQLLVSAYLSPVMSELIASLPILGIDGTVAKRLKTSQSAGRAHLKTGSLDGVSAIAGYVLNAQNKRFVVVMMINHNNASASKLAQDNLIEWVYHFI